MTSVQLESMITDAPDDSGAPQERVDCLASGHVSTMSLSSAAMVSQLNADTRSAFGPVQFKRPKWAVVTVVDPEVDADVDAVVEAVEEALVVALVVTLVLAVEVTVDDADDDADDVTDDDAVDDADDVAELDAVVETVVLCVVTSQLMKVPSA